MQINKLYPSIESVICKYRVLIKINSWLLMLNKNKKWK